MNSVSGSSTLVDQHVGALGVSGSSVTLGDDVGLASAAFGGAALERALDRVPAARIADVLMALFSASARVAEARVAVSSDVQSSVGLDALSDVSVGSSVSSKGARRRARKRARAAAARSAGHPRGGAGSVAAGSDRAGAPSEVSVAESVCSVESLPIHVVRRDLEPKLQVVTEYGSGYCYLWAVARGSLVEAARALGPSPLVADVLRSPAEWWESVDVMASLRVRVSGAMLHVLSPYEDGRVGDTRFFTLCRSAIRFESAPGSLGALARGYLPADFPVGDAMGHRVGGFGSERPKPGSDRFKGFQRAAYQVADIPWTTGECVGTIDLEFYSSLYVTVMVPVRGDVSLVLVKTRADDVVVGFIPYHDAGGQSAARDAVSDRTRAGERGGNSRVNVFTFPSRVEYDGGRSFSFISTVLSFLATPRSNVVGRFWDYSLDDFLHEVERRDKEGG